MKSAVVVGAGAGGLVAAWELARAGCEVTVLEAGDRPGGLLDRVVVDGLALDVGAEGYSVRGGAVERLVTDLGAADLITTPRPGGAWLQAASGAYPIPRRLVFGLPADPDADDVRAVVGELPAAREASGTLADLARAGYGERVLDDLVTPLVGGVYSAAPDDVTLADLAPGLAAAVASGTPLRTAVAEVAAKAPEGGAVHGLRGGMHTLADLLASSARAAGADLDCAEPVTGLSRRPGGWRVTTAGRKLDADLVVLAVPLDAAMRLLGGPVVLPTTRIDVVTLVLDATGLAGDEPRGTGVLVGAKVPGVAAKALTHSTAKWAWLREAAGGRDVLRLSYGRRGQPPASSGLDAGALARLARRDAEVLLGRPLPEPSAVRRTEWSILPPGTPGLTQAREWLTEQRIDGLGMVGAGISGVGLASVVPHARAEAVRLMQGTLMQGTLMQGNKES
ncbi:MAG: FAD-dependent oxidoreductase [Micropruina sp.]|uniref:protoporphyrinogen/coproporphyrinogen oxidase n=1 Tax=Micropruina sp. TaxID=2737536 RepID=UPI0039E363C4